MVVMTRSPESLAYRTRATLGDATLRLLDQPIGTLEDCLGDGEPEDLRGLEVDHQLIAPV
jgi:hypothetical protein